MILSHVLTFLGLLPAVSAVTILYPSLGGSETLTCECSDHQCQKVYWYRFLQETEKLQFLVFGNSANSVKHAEGIDGTRFKMSAIEGSKIMYSLRITGLQKNETGFYSCMFNSPKHEQKSQMPAGYYIRPGEHTPTTLPPTVKIPKKTTTWVNQPVRGIVLHENSYCRSFLSIQIFKNFNNNTCSVLACAES
uniref:Ig-like domain-containing protein n=1 Tax=Pygocentrus nattereri TaxID=42514 RepID=A0A3B4D5Y8_PYGNA